MISTMSFSWPEQDHKANQMSYNVLQYATHKIQAVCKFNMYEFSEYFKKKNCIHQNLEYVETSP